MTQFLVRLQSTRSTHISQLYFFVVSEQEKMKCLKVIENSIENKKYIENEFSKVCVRPV